MIRRLGVFALVAAAAVAVQSGNATADVLRGPAAFGDWRQDSPGVRRLIRPEDQPAPTPRQSPANPPEIVRMPEGAKPKVPDGFSVQMIASGIRNPRVIRVAPNGDLFVADSRANAILVFRISRGGARAVSHVFASGLHQPYGIAFSPPGASPRWVYVANSNGLVRFPYKNGDLKARGPAKTIVSGIPSEHHWTRDVAVSPDGRRLYYSVGSGSNVAEDMSSAPSGSLESWKRSQPLGAAWGSERIRADILSFDPNGKGRRVVATGIRNPSGIAIHPTTGRLWCVVNERDGLGDNVPFEYATEVKEGAFYGWPWYYIGGNPDPRASGERPDLRDKVTLPDVLLQGHSAPLQIAFYTGTQFPAAYRSDAFVTMHGSWNRASRTGYKVVRLIFKNGRPTGEYEDFMTGFVLSDSEVWGRPVGVAVGKEGSLYVTEDGNGTIWRVTYEGGRGQ